MAQIASPSLSVFRAVSVRSTLNASRSRSRWRSSSSVSLGGSFQAPDFRSVPACIARFLLMRVPCSEGALDHHPSTSLPDYT
jgi:hypothetical protein